MTGAYIMINVDTAHLEDHLGRTTLGKTILPLRTRALSSIAVAWALVLACSNAASPGGLDAPGGAVRSDLFAFVGVEVVPMDVETVLSDQTVVVRDGVIETVGPTGSVDVPEGAVTIDGEGRWLMPGLADMHVHLNSDDVETYLGHGITTVRNMWGFTALPEIVARVEGGDLLGPRIRTLSPGIDGPPVRWPQTQLITDPALADSMVQVQLGRGHRTLKVYSDLSLGVYDSIVAAAHRRDMEFAGHLPFAVSVEHALRSGQKSVEHLLGYRARPREEWAALVALTVEEGTWNCPTLAILRRANPAGASLRADLVRMLHEGDAPLLAGTDSGIDVTQPGVSIHEELDLLVAAGLTPYEALRAATVEGARYFGEDDLWGAVRVGMRGDLLLLGANPLLDTSATDRHEGVLRGDLWLPLSAD